MPGKVWSTTEEETLKFNKEAGLSAKEIAKEMGRTLNQIECKWRNLRSRQVIETREENLEKLETTDSTVITSQSHTVRTLAGALKAAEVDLSIWEVEKHTINKWDCVAKLKKKDKLVATELWQVKVWLRRKVPKMIEEGVKLFLNQIKAHKYESRKFEHYTNPCLLEMSLFDIHFGKLAWSKETGQNYDLKLAEAIYLNAAHELIAKARGFNIEKIVLPIGQDFFHIDGPNNMTTAGTPQDVDGRLAKIFSTGQKALINLIDLLMGIAPIHIFWIPGNHDWYTSWYLIKVIEAHYRMTPSVTIDSGESPRKFIEYGTNLIGFTHGNEEKHSSLPAIMAGSWPQEWARTTHREWHLGHFHRIKETHYAAADTIDGVLVRVLPSLSATDSWHYRKGYVGNMRAAQAYIYNKKSGYEAHLNANAKC